MTTYTMMHELMASTTTPLPERSRLFHLTRMWQALRSFEQAPQPTYEDWRTLSTAVNMIETLIEMKVLEDSQGLHEDAMTALSEASRRHQENGAALRLSGKGMQDTRALLEDYAQAVTHLPARTMIRAYRLTEIKVEKLFGKNTRRRGAGVRL